MKNIHTILSEIGMPIPEDKKAEFDKAVAENYKTTAEFEKKVTRLTEDLTAEKKRADDAEATLKGFEGKDFDTITRERDDWKKKHDDAVAKHQQEQEEREFNEMLNTSISTAKGKNAKAITALLDLDTLRKSKNQEKDIAAALEGIKKENEYLFDASGDPPARFDDPGNKGNPSKNEGKYTIGQLMRMKNQNPGLDISAYIK